MFDMIKKHLFVSIAKVASDAVNTRVNKLIVLSLDYLANGLDI